MKKTRLLRQGAALVTKEMKGTDAAAFPKHTASVESALIMLEGAATVTFPDAAHTLRAGDTFIVPAGEVHQVVASPDFTAVHVMPNDIRFDFNV